MPNIEKDRRFAFGKNWRGFLSSLTKENIRIAEASLQKMLMTDTLRGKTFLDIGSGSGLFSLAARNLGANVHSFDHDPLSVACTAELRSRYHPDDPDWSIEEGSILNERFIASLKSYDIVYAWGVLHHTGNMWAALAHSASLVKQKGILFIAIYNDQGRISAFWKRVKKAYCSGVLGKAMISCIFIPCFFSIALISCVSRKENAFRQYKWNRGMSMVHDWVDWLGGFPFEVASVDAIFHFLHQKNFSLLNLKMTRGSGNNQFVFVRKNSAASAGTEGTTEAARGAV